MKTVILSAAITAFAAPAAFAQDMSFDGLAGSVERDVEGDMEMNGAGLSYAGRVGGDLVMNGAGIEADAEVGGNLELNGAGVSFTGSVAGASEINAAGADLDGTFGGPVEINAGGAELSGVYSGPVRLNAGGARLNGRFDDRVEVRLDTGGGFLRRNRGRVVISGEINAPSYICAQRVEIERGARFNAPVEIIADEAPDTPSGFDAANIDFSPRGDARCRND